MGVLVVACLAAAMPLLSGSQLSMQKHRGGVRSAAPGLAPSYRVLSAYAMVVGLQLLLGAWMLAEYVLQVRVWCRVFCVCLCGYR